MRRWPPDVGRPNGAGIWSSAAVTPNRRIGAATSTGRPGARPRPARRTDRCVGAPIPPGLPAPEIVEAILDGRPPVWRRGWNWIPTFSSEVLPTVVIRSMTIGMQPRVTARTSWSVIMRSPKVTNSSALALNPEAIAKAERSNIRVTAVTDVQFGCHQIR